MSIASQDVKKDDKGNTSNRFTDATAEDDVLLVSAFDKSLRGTFASSSTYEDVAVLLILWEEADSTYIEEVKKFQAFFRNVMGYADTAIFLIPSTRSQGALSSHLTEIIYKKSRPQSLLILYYAGHGDPGTGAVWAAKLTGGPTLNWHEVQPCIYAAEGDILLIFDCCYAARAVRGPATNTIEFLAASDLQNPTPAPGDFSFTTVTMRVMERMMKETGKIVVIDLWKRLIRKGAKDEDLQKTPFRFCMSEGEDSIELRRLIPKSSTVGEPSPVALLSVSISLSKRPDKSEMLRLGRWFKASAPRSIASVTIDKLLLHTEAIQDFLHRKSSSQLSQIVAQDLRDREEPNSLTFDNVLSRGHQPYDDDEEVKATRGLKDLQRWNRLVDESLQSNLLLNPEFSTPEALENTEQDDAAKLIGLSYGARLRRLSLELRFGATEPNIDALPPTKLAFPEALPTDTMPWFRRGEFEGRPVLVEYMYYEPSPSGIATPETTLRIKRKAFLLREAKLPEFHMAPFVGYVPDDLHDRFGFVFELSQQYQHRQVNYTTLCDMYAKDKTRLVPLNVRFKIAFSLAQALFTLHSVDWLHKSLLSNNVLFFHPGDRPNWNIAEGDYSIDPKIFGFNLSRPEYIVSDNTREYNSKKLVYLHPSRWGRPAKSFSKVQDIYALGVILLEIGCWRKAERMDSSPGRKFENKYEEDVRRDLLAVARDQLPHLAGEQYSKAVISCLDDSFETFIPDKNDSSGLQKAFGRLVVDVIEKALAGL